MYRATFALILLTSSLASLAIGGPKGPPFYDAKRDTEEKEEAAKKAVGELPGATPARIAELLADPAVQVRDEVFEALVTSEDTKLLERLIPLLQHADPFVRAAIAEVYGQTRFPPARKALERIGLKARDEETVLEAIWALEDLADPQSAKALEAIARRGHPASEFRAQGDALLALVKVDPDAARKLAEKAVRDRSGAQRIAGLEALGRLDPRPAAKEALSVLAERVPLGKKEASWRPALCRAALDVLARWCERTQDPALAREVVSALIAALERHTGLEADGIEDALRQATREELRGKAWADWWSVKGEGWRPRDLDPSSKDEGDAGDAQEEAQEEAQKKAQRKDEEKDEKKGKKKKGKKKQGKKKKGKKKKDEERDSGDDEDDADREPRERPGRVETGKQAGSQARFCGIPLVSKRLLFLQDTSGGMSNNPVDEDTPGSPLRIAYSKRELIGAIQGLPGEARANVLFFATTYRAIAPRTVALASNREKLVAFVEEECKTPKGKGMTRSNLYDALVFALEDPTIDSVFFLSEGGQNEGRYATEERLLRHLERLNVYRRVRVNCLQVTTKKKRGRFLKELSKRTGGTYYPKSFLKK